MIAVCAFTQVPCHLKQLIADSLKIPLGFQATSKINAYKVHIHLAVFATGRAVLYSALSRGNLKIKLLSS